MIFYGVVCSAWQRFRNVGPFIAVFPVLIKHDLLFHFGPWFFDNLGIQVVVPSVLMGEVPFPALLASFEFVSKILMEFLGNLCPPFGSIFLN